MTAPEQTLALADLEREFIKAGLDYYESVDDEDSLLDEHHAWSAFMLAARRLLRARAAQEANR